MDNLLKWYADCIKLIVPELYTNKMTKHLIYSLYKYSYVYAKSSSTYGHRELY